MPLDPRSRERLEALGRTLPQPLSAPDPPPTRRESSAPRHAVETEEDPEQLFRELMTASADGSVPPHLLDRLRQLESGRRRSTTTAAAQPSASAQAAGANPEPRRTPAQASRQGRGHGGRAAAPGSEEAELYTAFAQLLLEDEELD